MKLKLGYLDVKGNEIYESINTKLNFNTFLN